MTHHIALLLVCLGYFLQAYASGFNVDKVGVLLVGLAKTLVLFL